MKVHLEGSSEEVAQMLRALAGSPAPVQFQRLEADPPVEQAECPKAFKTVILDWCEGFDVTGTKHWEEDPHAPASSDRSDALFKFANSRQAGAALQWVKTQGGLTQAVWSLMGEPMDTHQMEIARGVAVNMTQVGSVLFPDLSALLEHFDPFKEE